MSAIDAAYDLLDPKARASLAAAAPARLHDRPDGAAYLDLRGLPLAPLPDVDEERIAGLCRVVRGLIFAAVDGAQSGHPGGSSSKAEQVTTLLASGALGFDAWRPKRAGRDRVVWSAGHCSPLAHALGAVVYETLRRKGVTLTGADAEAALYPEDLARFRKWGGPSGHVESTYALADTSTGSSGHGLSAALGFAVLHRSCGLPTKAFVIAGDAETEEGMSYEARNVAARLGLRNLVASLDYNAFGIDGSIFEAMPAPYVSHWLSPGWNVIEAEGHVIRELAYAYRLAAAGFGAERPTVVVCHSTKGLGYGKLEDTADSHGTPLKHDDYVASMRELGFAIPGVKGDVTADLKVVTEGLSRADSDYLAERLGVAAAKIAPKSALESRMATALAGRPLRDYRALRRPAELPAELVFEEGALVPTRRATEAWFAWAMRQTAFFYLGAGDLAKSVLTGKAEQVYGLIGPDNPLGRGLRFGIAEQNMAMMSCAMSQDTLPGGYRPMTAFATYAVFTCMMANAVRMTLINSAVNVGAKAFFIMLAAHDGPETGEDGPTHQGLFWMSLFAAYPGIKVYKPLDANEAVEMLFHAVERGEPVAFSVVRPGAPVLKRGDGTPPAREAVNGAYVFKPYRGGGKPKLALAVCGGQVMANVLEILPELEASHDVKIIAVTSPQLFEELRKKDPAKAEAVLSAEERRSVVALHNGWSGFLYPFLLPADHAERTFGMDEFLRSGSPRDIYQAAGFDPAGLREKFRKLVR